MSLKSVKNKIKSIDKTRQVTKAMEAVSAVKMRKSQAVALATRPYALHALKILRSISHSIDVIHHPLMKANDNHRTCIIVISADKGLAGSYGSTLLKSVYTFLEKQGLKKEDVDLVTVGKKSYEHFAKRGYNVVWEHEHWSDGIDFDAIRPVAEFVEGEFLKGTYGSVFIVFTGFISTLKQVPYARKLLPVNIAAVEQSIREIIPQEGRYSELRESALRSTDPSPAVILEPSPATIMSELIPELFRINVYHSVLEANASEHSARMIAMKNASDNAGEISRGLKLRFSKVRQASITREVSEIVGGMEAMKVSE